MPISVESELQLAEKVIARDPAKHLVINRLLVIKQGMNTALLAKIGQRPEEAGFTQMHLVALAIMLRAIPPQRLQGTELLAVTRYTRGVPHTAQWMSESLWSCSLITITPHVLGVFRGPGSSRPLTHLVLCEARFESPIQATTPSENAANGFQRNALAYAIAEQHVSCVGGLEEEAFIKAV